MKTHHGIKKTKSYKDLQTVLNRYRKTGKFFIKRKKITDLMSKIRFYVRQVGSSDKEIYELIKNMNKIIKQTKSVPTTQSYNPTGENISKLNNKIEKSMEKFSKQATEKPKPLSKVLIPLPPKSVSALLIPSYPNTNNNKPQTTIKQKTEKILFPKRNLPFGAQMSTKNKNVQALVKKQVELLIKRKNAVAALKLYNKYKNANWFPKDAKKYLEQVKVNKAKANKANATKPNINNLFPNTQKYLNSARVNELNKFLNNYRL